MSRALRPAGRPAHQPNRLVGGVLVIIAVLLWGCASGTQDAPDVAGVTRPLATHEPTAPAETAPPSVGESLPDVATPTAVRAPAAGIDTSLVAVGLQSDGAMELPDPGTGAWYRLGPRPGEPGPAVVIGHVDSVAGPDVFHGLGGLAAGDLVHVDDEAGVQHTFVVTDVETVRKDALPYDRIWTDTDEPVLRLITCGGPYERDNGGYQSNVVVYAELADPSAAA